MYILYVACMFYFSVFLFHYYESSVCCRVAEARCLFFVTCLTFTSVIHSTLPEQHTTFNLASWIVDQQTMETFAFYSSSAIAIASAMRDTALVEEVVRIEGSGGRDKGRSIVTASDAVVALVSTPLPEEGLVGSFHIIYFTMISQIV